MRTNRLLSWRGEGRVREGDRSLWDDLTKGRAGAPLRIGLSLAAAAALMSTLMFLLGMIEHGTGRVDTEHIATGLALAGAAWCGSLVWLWSSYRKWRRLIATICIVLGIWLVAIPLAVVLAEVVRDDGFLIASTILLAVSGTIVTIAVNAHGALEGRPLEDRTGAIAVNCPKCNYSMVGLESCQCPECGTAYTLDRIIREQNYALLRRVDSTDAVQVESAPPLPPGATPAVTEGA